MAEPNGVGGPWWQLVNTLIPAVIPTAVAAGLEVWRVRRRDREHHHHHDEDDDEGDDAE